MHIEYNNSRFGIIDAWGMHSDQKIWLRFSQEWLASLGDIKELEHDFDQLKQLRSPLAVLLCESLSDNLESTDEWKIDIHELSALLCMKEKYAAHILPKIKSAMKKIRDRVSSNYQLEIYQTDSGQTCLTFKKDHL